MNDRLRLHLVKQSITEELNITLKEFLLLDDSCKLELFNLFQYLKKGR